ncbi:hypothetical protein HAX54_011438, partial [Datura stramonium]|nr:hypothetical protein [Datura stramonium]
ELQPAIQTEDGFLGLAHPRGITTLCPGHCSTCVAQGIRVGFSENSGRRHSKGRPLSHRHSGGKTDDYTALYQVMSGSFLRCA